MSNLIFNSFDGNSYSSYYGDINPSINKELNLNQNKITNLGTPVNNLDAATKKYVDEKIGLKSETIEDTTHTFTQWDDYGPKVMVSKDLSSTIALKFTIIVNGTLGGERGYALGVKVWPHVIQYVSSGHYDRPLFFLNGNATTPVTFSNSIFSYFTMVGEARSISIQDALAPSQRTLYGSGYGQESSDPGIMYIQTDGNFLSEGYNMVRCNQSLSRINLTIRYVVTKYYFG